MKGTMKMKKMKTEKIVVYEILTAILLGFAAALLCAGCASLKDKSVSVASRADALRIESSGSAQSGTISPNIMVGGGGNSISTSHAFTDSEKAVRTISYTKSTSFFGSLFGLDLGSETLTYTGTTDETGKDVAAIIRSVRTARTNTDSEIGAE